MISYDMKDWFKITDTENQLTHGYKYFIYSEEDPDLFDIVLLEWDADNELLFLYDDENGENEPDEWHILKYDLDRKEYWAMEINYPKKLNKGE